MGVVVCVGVCGGGGGGRVHALVRLGERAAWGWWGARMCGRGGVGEGGREAREAPSACLPPPPRQTPSHPDPHLTPRPPPHTPTSLLSVQYGFNPGSTNALIGNAAAFPTGGYSQARGWGCVRACDGGRVAALAAGWLARAPLVPAPAAPRAAHCSPSSPPHPHTHTRPPARHTRADLRAHRRQHHRRRRRWHAVHAVCGDGSPVLHPGRGGVGPHHRRWVGGWVWV